MMHHHHRYLVTRSLVRAEEAIDEARNAVIEARIQLPADAADVREQLDAIHRILWGDRVEVLAHGDGSALSTRELLAAVGRLP